MKEVKEPLEVKKIFPSKEEKGEAEKTKKENFSPSSFKEDFWPRFGASIKDFLPPFCFNFHAFFWFFLFGNLGFLMGYFGLFWLLFRLNFRLYFKEKIKENLKNIYLKGNF